MTVLHRILIKQAVLHRGVSVLILNTGEGRYHRFPLVQYVLLYQVEQKNMQVKIA